MKKVRHRLDASRLVHDELSSLYSTMNIYSEMLPAVGGTLGIVDNAKGAFYKI